MKWLLPVQCPSWPVTYHAVLHITPHCAVGEECCYHVPDKLLEKAADVAQEVWLTRKKFQVQSPGLHKLEMAVRTCNLSTWDLLAAGSDV